MSMIKFTNEEQVKLQKLGADAVVLFGSRATGTASDESDYDFGVLLNDEGRAKRQENYHVYYTAVYDFFAERVGDLKGLDVVFLDRAPLEMRRHVLQYGRTLFERLPGQVADFNARTMLLYADFEPYRIMMNKAVLDRVESL